MPAWQQVCRSYRHSGLTGRTEMVMSSGTRRPSRMISCSCAPSGESGSAVSARSRSPAREVQNALRLAGWWPPIT
jgi:hypothetical protein